MTPQTNSETDVYYIDHLATLARNRVSSRWYKLGFYTANGARVLCHELEPMTHEEALAMKSKCSQPKNWFLFEVAL